MQFTDCTKTHRPVTNSLNAIYDNNEACYFYGLRKYIVMLSTHLWTKSAIVCRQIADFVCRLLQNKSNMMWNFCYASTLAQLSLFSSNMTSEIASCSTAACAVVMFSNKTRLYVMFSNKTRILKFYLRIFKRTTEEILTSFKV